MDNEEKHVSQFTYERDQFIFSSHYKEGLPLNNKATYNTMDKRWYSHANRGIQPGTRNHYHIPYDHGHFTEYLERGTPHGIKYSYLHFWFDDLCKEGYSGEYILAEYEDRIYDAVSLCFSDISLQKLLKIQKEIAMWHSVGQVPQLAPNVYFRNRVDLSTIEDCCLDYPIDDCSSWEELPNATPLCCSENHPYPNDWPF